MFSVFSPLFLLLPGVALLLTFSKGNIMGLITGIFVYLSKKKKIYLYLLIMLFILGIFVFWKAPFLKKGFLTYQGRLEVWRVSWKMITYSPFKGFGWGKFSLFFPFFRDKQFREILPDVIPKHAHNDYLELWVEGGLSSLISFLLILSLIFKKVWEGNYSFWVIAIFGILVEGMVSFPFHFPLTQALFFSLAGLFSCRKSSFSFKWRKCTVIPFLFLFLFFHLFPFLSHLEFRKGNRLSSNGKYLESLVYYQRALKLDPSHELAWVNLGYSLYKVGKKDEAEKVWKRALRLNPASFPALANLLYYYKEEGKEREAKKIEEKLRNLWPEKLTNGKISK